MGISPEVAAKVVEAIKADAAAHGGTVRTKRVLEALKAQHLSATSAAVKILADFLGFKIETGPEAGRTGVGRPFGVKDRRPREFVSRKPSTRELVRDIASKHPDWTMEQIGIAYGQQTKTKPMTRQLVAFHLKPRDSSDAK